MESALKEMETTTNPEIHSEGTHRVIQLVRAKVLGKSEEPIDVEVVQHVKGFDRKSEPLYSPALITDPIKESIITVDGKNGPIYYRTVTDVNDLEKARELFEFRKSHMISSPLPPIFVEILPTREIGKYNLPTTKVDPPQNGGI